MNENAKPLEDLTPTKLWENFYEITQIPHPSKKEEKLREFLTAFAISLDLEYQIDQTGNLLIRKPATPGMENKEIIILQAHLDMVPQKNADVVHDFENDPLKLLEKDGWIMADGTTLGADNGIGIAAIMAVLESNDLRHGPIEALFTVDEETGLNGAAGLDPKMLSGKTLLNLDSEEEGEFCISCAGGTNVVISFNCNEDIHPLPKQNLSYKIKVAGLKGGHSGVDIHMGRGNSIKILGRILRHVEKFGVRISSFEGGTLRNAIPREAEASISIPENNFSDFLESLDQIRTIIKEELRNTEPDLSISMGKIHSPDSMLTSACQQHLLDAICLIPHGVVRMSDSVNELVETSNNLAVVKKENCSFTLTSLMRSSVDTAKDDLKNTFMVIAKLINGRVKFDGEYPGWRANPDSEILKRVKKEYANQFGTSPEIKAIHAGLECGIIGGNYPDLDMISFGPTIKYPHSPDEKVEIKSVQKFWELLVSVLKN